MREKARALYADTLFRNSFYLMLSTATMAGIGFFFWLIVAHLYTPDEVGVASTLISAMIFIGYLSLLGFNSTFIRFLPRSKHRSAQIDTGLILVGVAALVIGLGYAVIAPLLAPRLGVLHHSWLYVAGFALLAMAFAVNLVTDSIFIAYRSAKYNFYIDGLAGSSSQLVMSVVLVGLGSFGIFAAQGTAALVAMCLSLFFLVKSFGYRPQLKLDRQTLVDVKRYSFGNYLANLLNIAPTMILPLVVLSELGDAAAGYYYLAFMMANLLFTIAYAVSQSLFAEGSYGEIGLRKLVRRSVIILGGIMIPASLLLALLGPQILKLFGDHYSANSYRLILTLAASGIPVAAYVVGGTLLRITKQVGALVIANLIYAVSIGVLAVVLVPRGLAWAGVAWMTGSALSAAVMFVFLWRGRRFSKLS